MKRCSKCLLDKAASSFYKHSTTRDGLHSYCKPCFMETNKNWARRNPDRMRSYALKKKYGLSLERAKEIIRLQGGRCAICVEKLELLKEAHVDHNHKTGQIRGILCGSCNRAIGLLKDDPFIVSEASAYLENAEEFAQYKGELAAAEPA